MGSASPLTKKRSTMSIRMTADEKTTRRRQYTRDNRELWKALGYRMVSGLIHDDDRVEVLAELEVKRAVKLAAIATDKGSSINLLVQIARRNLTPTTPPKKMTEFLVSCKRLDNLADIEFAIEQARAAHTVFRNCGTAIESAGTEQVKQRLYAKEVAYGNLSAAWFNMAEVRAADGENTTVFGAEKEL
jgi:hypothetical protein